MRRYWTISDLVIKQNCQKAVIIVDLTRKITAQNWDGSKIQIRLIDGAKWAKWDERNEKNKIHPTQKEFTAAQDGK